MNFNERVYNLCKKIPPGKVSTYRILARKLNTKAYRAVGNALNKNLYAKIIPCHRVINSSGFVGGFNGGINKKIELLKKEGILINKNNKINLNKYLFKFK